MEKVPLLIFVGAVGAGKTTIVRRLLQLHPTWAYEEVEQLARYKSSMKLRYSTVDGIACEAAVGSTWRHVLDYQWLPLIRPLLIYVEGEGNRSIQYAAQQLQLSNVWWRRLARKLKIPVFTVPQSIQTLLQLYVKADAVITNYPFDASFSKIDTQLFEILRELDIETPWTDKVKEGLRW